MITVRTVCHTDWLAEAGLIAEYAAECSVPEVGKISPYAEAYAAMESCGIMRSLAVFDEETMLGFATVLTPILPHYSKRMASVECIFATKLSRGLGAGTKLLRATRAYAKEAHCVGIMYSAPVGSQFEKVLARSKRYLRTSSVFVEVFA